MVQGHAEVATKSERISSTRRGKRFRSYVAGQKRVSISQSLSDSGLIGRNPLSPIHLSRRSFDEGGTLSCHAIASRLAIASCEGWLASAAAPLVPEAVGRRLVLP